MRYSNGVLSGGHAVFSHESPILFQPLDLTQGKAVADEQQGTAVLFCACYCGVFEGAPRDVAWGL